MAEILSGRPVASDMLENLIKRADALKERGIVPTLATVRAGEDENQKSYERSSALRCGKAGIAVKNYVLPADVSEDELLSVIEEINSSPDIHGCTVLLPLPAHIDGRRVCDALSPAKDLDAVTSYSISNIFMGREGFAPVVAEACTTILDYYGKSIAGKDVCIVGRSLVSGRPVSMLMLSRDATVTICHTKTEKLSEKCRKADIIISATGSAGLIKKDFVRPGQIIIDIGISVGADGKIRGDADFDEIGEEVEAVTPVPGGVGVVASTILARHLIEAAERSADIS